LVLEQEVRVEEVAPQPEEPVEEVVAEVDDRTTSVEETATDQSA
jgi:hypothetical protein